ncbi:hypothetical protein SAMN05444358_102222 [Ruegeria halocynthiae]|uniref:Uncharacterized protein n=1 Tax=Ruegeria halocynthiae TaxID=985054 RepID=A0A1H2YB55_9RHOB|nr:hypothetical protein [Ruegeria halocynthiae]SDX02453.1 hypothetical protein SAMN05444358_102222 [Ruegeria halocynthiae]
MTHTTLTPIRFENALWEGHVTSDCTPQIEVLYLGELLPDVELTPDADGWTLRIPVPSTALSEGVHCVIIRDESTDQKLGEFTIVAGAPVEDDLKAEVALLRAELDMLKRAFRRSQAPQG